MAIADSLQKGVDVARNAGVPVDSISAKLKPVVSKFLLEKGIGFVRRSGFRAKVLERGHVVCEMPLSGNKNHIGTMYAGALFTLAEVPGGALYLTTFDTRKFIPIVTEMSIKFLKPAKGTISFEITMPDERIAELEAEAEANGKAVFELEGELKNAGGEVVATSHGVYQLRRK